MAKSCSSCLQPYPCPYCEREIPDWDQVVAIVAVPLAEGWEVLCEFRREDGGPVVLPVVAWGLPREGSALVPMVYDEAEGSVVSMVDYLVGFGHPYGLTSGLAHPDTVGRARPRPHR